MAMGFHLMIRRPYYAFSSDFRTHITEKRWVKYLAFLNELTNKYALDKNRVMTLKWNNQSFAIESSRSAPVQWINYQQTNYINDINHRLIEIRTPTMSVILNKRKGLAIESCSVNNKPLFGTISHGYYEDMDLAFDWFSGNAVIKRPGKPQITDLMGPSSIQVSQEHQLQTAITCKLEASCGQIIKTITVFHEQNHMRIDYSFDFDQLPLTRFI